MAVRFRNEFYSDSGVAWKIDIHDSAFSGTPANFQSAVNEVRISYKGGADMVDPFFTSEFIIPFQVQTTAEEQLITDINAAQEERFGVMVYKNAVLEWVGVLVADMTDHEDVAFPFNIDLKFTDGIARLKDCEYKSETTVWNGALDLMDHIIKALTFCGTMQYYGATDPFMRVAIGWHTTITGYYSTRCALKYNRLRHEVWYDYEDGVLTYKNAYDVLKEILLSLNARISMAGGKYNIIQVTEHKYTTFYSQTFDKAGALLSSNTADSNRVTPTVLQRMEGGQFKYYPALRKVITAQKHKMSTNWGNLLPPPTSGQYETQVTMLDTIYGGTGTALTLKFDGITHQWFIGTSGGILRFKYRMNVILTLSDLSKRYLYNGTSGTSPYTWETDSAKYCLFYSPVGGNSTWSNTLNISFMTPEIPEDCTATFKFYDLGVVDQYYQAYAPPAGTTYGYETINFFMKQPVDGSDAEIPDTKYYAHNYKAGTTTYVDSKIVMERPVGLVGDFPTGVRTLSMFETTDNLANPLAWTPAGTWRTHNISSSASLRQFAAKECLAAQRVPIVKFDGAFINSSITGSSVIVWNSHTKNRVFVPITLNMRLVDDIAKGEWFDIITPVT